MNNEFMLTGKSFSTHRVPASIPERDPYIDERPCGPRRLRLHGDSKEMLAFAKEVGLEHELVCQRYIHRITDDLFDEWEANAIRLMPDDIKDKVLESLRERRATGEARMTVRVVLRILNERDLVVFMMRYPGHIGKAPPPGMLSYPRHMLV